MLLLLTAAGFAQDLVRVDVPDHPQAIATSAAGSVLAAPPEDGTPWRAEPLAQPDVVTLDVEGQVDGFDVLSALGAGPWHERGERGAGVRVAVFDLQWADADLYADELGTVTSHDCWAQRSCELPMDTLRPRYPFEVGSHGVACASVIRDIAPDAEIALVRVNGQTTLENAVAWAIRERIDIISMSLSFYGQSYSDGTGTISELMPALEAANVLMVKSAGNSAREHREEQFHDADLDGLHEWEGGGESVSVALPAGTSTIMVLWDQFRSCGDTDLDVVVTDDAGQVVGWSADTQVEDEEEGDPECSPVERVNVSLDEEAIVHLSILLRRGDPSVRFRVFARDVTIEGYEPAGSVTDPGTHPVVFAVGAVRARDYLLNPTEGFSSHGPTAAGVPKPDIAGPDGLSSPVYGQGAFYGTSASTPAVAGALALVMGSDPSLTSRDAARILEDHARADADLWSGQDAGLGAGRAVLPSLGAPPRLCGGERALALPLLLWCPWTRRRRCGPSRLS